MFYKENSFQDSSIGKIPKDWKIRKTEELGEVVTGITPSTLVKEYWGGDCPFVTPTDITNRKYVEKTERKVSAKALERRRLIPKDSVLVTCIASIGKMALAFENCVTNQQINAIICKNEADPHYVYYALGFRVSILESWAGKTTSPIIKKSMFEKFPIPIPTSLSEQRQIVEVLGVIDSAIELADRVIAKTERLKKGLMQQLLTRGIGHTEYKNTQLGIIPESWQTANLGEVLIDIKYGTSAKANSEVHGYPVLGIPNVVGGKINRTNLRYVDLSDAEKRSLTLEDGDILLVRTNANPDYIGRCALFENMKGIWLYASYLIRIRPDRKKVLPSYLVRFLQSEKGRKQFLSIARTSAGNYNINSQEIRRITFNLPRLPEQINEQQRIVEILSVVDEKLDFEIREKEKVKKIKKGLMDLLLTGKVRIRVD